MLDIQTIIKNSVNARADSMAQAKIAPRFRYPIDADTAARMLAAAYRVEVEARHRTFTMDAGTQDKIAHAARWLTDATLPPSLLLYGSMPGTGKTTLALAIRRASLELKTAYGTSGLNDARRLCAKAGEMLPRDFEKVLDRRKAAVLWPEYHTARDLVTMATAADAAQRRTYDYATNCSCLIIDDLGTEPVEVNNYGTRVTPLLDLLYTRYDAMKPTIITTNFGKNQIVETYGTRLFDRLCEMSCRINYGGNQSYRVL